MSLRLHKHFHECAKTNIGALALAIVLLAYVQPAAAGLDIYCPKFRDIVGDELKRPQAPSCLDLPFAGDDATFNSCRSEMESYSDDMSEYVKCLSEESRDAIEDHNKAIERFNCHARGGTACY